MSGEAAISASRRSTWSPFIRLARVGVVLGEIAGIAGKHAVTPAVRTSLCERDEMVDAGLHLAARLYPGEANAAVGASSAPIEIAALVDHVGHQPWLFPESLRPTYHPFIHQGGIRRRRKRRSLRLGHPGSARRIMLAICVFRYAVIPVVATAGAMLMVWLMAIDR